jgi:hypothetical protein
MPDHHQQAMQAAQTARCERCELDKPVTEIRWFNITSRATPDWPQVTNLRPVLTTSDDPMGVPYCLACLAEDWTDEPS